MGNIICCNDPKPSKKYCPPKSDPSNNCDVPQYISLELSICQSDFIHPRPSQHTVPEPRRIVVALCNFTAIDATEVSFRKGDRMEILNTSEGDWFTVRHINTRREGLIPGNFVTDKETIEGEDCFFENVSRKEAEKLLLDNNNSRGTFLVRPSESIPDSYSLSIKDWEERCGYHVKHYNIKSLANGRYYISTNKTFQTLSDLVYAYSRNAYGLCHVLLRACPKPKQQLWDFDPSYMDSWEIPRYEIQLIRHLRRGNFSEVYYGKWRNTIEVAVKSLREGTMSTQAFLEEAAIMIKFRHKRLVTLYAVCTKEEPIYIVQEYMSKGSLLDFLRKEKDKKLGFEELAYIAFQVASGMEYLESQQVIHRDLAARNVLIGENNVAKICDFGLARVIEENEYYSKQDSKLPLKWTAPEALMCGKFSTKSDVWSYGILLMELFTYGQIPYPGMNGREVVEQVQRGYRMPKPTNYYVHGDIYRIMLNCWDVDSENRPTFEFLTHYFQRFSVEEVLD